MAAHAQAQNNNDPVIQSAIYDGNSVRVTWTPSSDTGVTGYIIQLAWLGGSEPVIAYQSQVFQGQNTGIGNLPLSQPLNTDVTYQVLVQAQWGSSSGQNSSPVILPTARPTLDEALYYGHGLRVSWQPSWQAAAGYEVVVVSNTIGTTYAIPVAGQQTSSTLIDNDKLGGGLGDNSEWVVYVAAVGENSASARSAPAAFPPVSMVCPVLGKTNLYRDGNRIVARWTGSNASGVVGYRLSASNPANATCYSIDVPGADANNATLALPAALADSESFKLSVTALTASGAGLVSPLTPIVSSRPLLTSADYTGSALKLEWVIPYNPAVTGYTLQAVSLSSGQSVQATVSNASATSGSIPLGTPLDSSQAWVAQIIANGADGGVGAEGELLPLITGSASFTSLVVSADGGSLDVTWQAPASLTSPELTTVSLLLDGTVGSSFAVNGNTARLALPVNAAGATLSVGLAPARGVARNTNTSALGVPLGIPQISGWDTDAVSGSGTLSWAALSGAPGYRLSLPGGQHLDLTGTSTTLTPAQLASGGNAALVTLRSAGVVDGCTLVGPASAAFALATTPVRDVRVEYDGATLSARWSAVSDGQGYPVSVLKTLDGTTSVDQAFTSSAGVLEQSWAYTPGNPAADLSVMVQANQPVLVFVQLARYIAVADNLWEILGDLPDSGALTPVQSNAANTLRDLAAAVATSWNVRLVDSVADARLQAPVTDAFAFQARVTDRDGPLASREVASLGLTALSAGGRPGRAMAAGMGIDDSGTAGGAGARKRLGQRVALPGTG